MVITLFLPGPGSHPHLLTAIASELIAILVAAFAGSTALYWSSLPTTPTGARLADFGAAGLADRGQAGGAGPGGQAVVDAARPQRAAVDEPGVGLDEGGAGRDALPGVIGRLD